MSGLTPRYTDFFEEVPAPPGGDNKPNGKPLVSPEDLENAEDMENFKLPRAADLKSEDDDDKDSKKPDATATKGGDGKGTATGGDDDDDEPEVTAARILDDGGRPAASVEDPGEFKPSDLSFDVVIYDKENKNPKTVKIKSVEQFEDLLEKENTNFGSPGALLKANRLAAKMEATLEREQKEHEGKAAKYKEYKDSQVERAQRIVQNEREIAYLMDRGDLPAMPKKYANADWDDPEVAKQPAVKAQLELFAFMKKENAALKKAGLEPMTSMVAVFNAYQNSESKKKNDAKKKDQGEARKAAGARVASASSNPVSTVPKGISVGRTGLLK